MAEQLGPLTRIGWQREAVANAPDWPPTAIALTALLPVRQDATHEIPDVALTQAVSAGVGADRSDVIARPIVSSVELPLLYSGFDGLFAAGLGHEATLIGSTAMPEPLGSGVYRHIYELDPWHNGPWRADDGVDPDVGLVADQYKPCRGTLALDKQVAVWEFRGMAIDRMACRFAGREALLTLDMLGYALTTPAAVNTSLLALPALPNVSAPGVFSHDMTWRIGAYSTSVALTSGNDLQIRDWGWTLNNHLALDYGPLTGLLPGEMQREASPEGSVTFTVPRYANDTVRAWHSSQTLLMASATCVGPTIPGTATAYGLRWYFPSCRVTGLQMGSASQATRLECELALLAPTGVPAGFPASSHGGMFMCETIGPVPAHQML